MDWQGINLDVEQNEPLYRQVAQRIRRLIRTNKIKPGEKLPTSKELQKHFRVSLITVEAGVNLLVDEKYLTRRPRLGTFVSPTPGKTVKASPQNSDNNKLPLLINVIFSEISAADIYWYRILHTLEEELQRADYRMIFTQLQDRETDATRLVAGCGGVILCGYNSTRLVKALERQGLPLVLIGSLDEPDQIIDRVDAVVHDDCHRAAISVQHLIDLEHRRLACVTGPTGSQLEENHLRGFHEATAAAGINKDMFSFVSVSSHTIEEGIKAGYKLLCTTPRPSAVFACDDRIAAGIIHTAGKLGIRVPEDLSVVGCGGMELCEIITPRLTTTASFPENSARIAVGKLFKQRNQSNYHREKTVIQVEEISFGESTKLYRETNNPNNNTSDKENTR